MWQIFHGPNALERDEAVDAVISRMKSDAGDDGIAEMNITRITADDRFDDLIRASETMPVFTDTRLVLARNFIRSLERARTRRQSAADKKGSAAREGAKDDYERLIAYLPALPESTRLIFIEDESLGESSALMKSVKSSGGKVELFTLPADPPSWLQKRARVLGGQISAQAAATLASRIHQGNKNDRDHFEQDAATYMYKLDNELRKLIGFVGGRSIEARDVEALVPSEDVADVFKFTDAVAARNAGAAWQEMRAILSRGEHPLVLLTHLARQVRLLIQVKDGDGMSRQELASSIGVHPFVVDKAMQQANRFHSDELPALLEALLDADIAIKSGTMEPDAALDVMVAAMCTKGPASTHGAPSRSG